MQLAISFIQKDNRTDLGLILDHISLTDILFFCFKCFTGKYTYHYLSIKTESLWWYLFFTSKWSKFLLFFPSLNNRNKVVTFLADWCVQFETNVVFLPRLVSHGASLPFNKSPVSSPLHNYKTVFKSLHLRPSSTPSFILFKVRKCSRPTDNLGISGATLTESVTDLRKSLQDTTTRYQRNL